MIWFQLRVVLSSVFATGTFSAYVNIDYVIILIMFYSSSVVSSEGSTDLKDAATSPRRPQPSPPPRVPLPGRRAHDPAEPQRVPAATAATAAWVQLPRRGRLRPHLPRPSPSRSVSRAALAAVPKDTSSAAQHETLGGADSNHFHW